MIITRYKLSATRGMAGSGPQAGSRRREMVVPKRPLHADAYAGFAVDRGIAPEAASSRLLPLRIGYGRTMEKNNRPIR
jgi:hypothetical protein